jgi:hypothetical protein
MDRAKREHELGSVEGPSITELREAQRRAAAEGRPGKVGLYQRIIDLRVRRAQRGMS